MPISLNCKYLSKFIAPHELEAAKAQAELAAKTLHDKTGLGNDFLGWTTWPTDYDKEEFARIKKAAQEIRENYDVLVVAGIGGSYLGARCAIEALRGLYPTDKLEIIYFE